MLMPAGFMGRCLWAAAVAVRRCRQPVEDGRDRRALRIPEGMAVRLPLVGINGEPADHPVADQAAQPVVASHLSRPGQQAVGCGVVAAAFAAEGQGDQVQRAAAQPELIPAWWPSIPAGR